MGFLRRLGFKNRRTEHYQRNYEEEKSRNKGNQGNDLEVEVSIEHDGLRSPVKEDRKDYYHGLLSEITVNDREKIRRIAETSGTLNMVFRRMGEEGIPLGYLVALGLVDEIDIVSYQNIQVKGLSTGEVIDVDELEYVDETLVMQMQSLAEEMPKLKNVYAGDIVLEGLDDSLRGTGLDEGEDGREDRGKEFKEEQDLNQDDEDNLRGEAGGVEEEGDKDFEETSLREKDGCDRDTDGSEMLEDGRVLEEPDEEQENVFSRLMDLAEGLGKKHTSVESGVKGDGNSTTEKEDTTVRESVVYVIAENLRLPVLREYKLVKATSMEHIIQYAYNKNNLLVITEDIPSGLKEVLLDWLIGVEESGNRYRIVTLDGKEVGHSLIEDTIELTDSALNGYYKEFPDELYEGESVGSFNDISSFFK